MANENNTSIKVQYNHNLVPHRCPLKQRLIKSNFYLGMETLHSEYTHNRECYGNYSHFHLNTYVYMTNTDSRELGLSSGYLQMLVQQSLLLTSCDVLISGNLSARALTLTGGCGSYSILLGLRGDVHQSTNQIVYGKDICTYILHTHITHMYDHSSNFYLTHSCRH